MISLDYEMEYWNNGKRFIAGVDEAGRGPLAGPVVAAAAIFPSDIKIDGVNDSKQLSAQERERLFDVINAMAISIGVGIVDHTIIDEVNILNATFRSMHEAIGKLTNQPDHLLIDGPRFSGANIPFTTIIDGDAKCFSIAAASIVAKVTRDRLMVEYDKQYPQYGFAKHKGYGTKAHLDAIRKYGQCEIHRRSFKMPIKLAEENA
ncbi:MAG: ribonuclease HII [Ignavibacteriales bacterium]|nr:ribonuclease HII [Ignavibacteriales bacterium]